MNGWVYLALVVAFIVFARATAAFLQNRSQLDVALAEIRGWEHVKIRIVVGGLTIIVSDLEGLRSYAFQQAREQAPLGVGQYGAVVPPAIIARTVVVTDGGQGWMPYGGMSDKGESVPVILYASDIPAAHLGLDSHASLATWFPDHSTEESK